MAQVHKFLFDNSFDPDDVRRKREAEQRRRVEAEEAARRAEQEALAGLVEQDRPPTFGEEELAVARAEAFGEGEAAGRSAAMATIENHAAQVLDRVAGRLGDLLAAQRRADEVLAEQAVQIALAITRKLMPQLERRHGLDEVEALIRDCLRDVPDEPRVVIRVSDGVIDAVRARLDAAGDDLGFPGHVVLLAESAMGPADCRVEWADGGAERLSDRVWQDIESAIARVLEYPQAAVPDPCAPDPAAPEAASPEAPPPEAAPAQPAPARRPEARTAARKAPR